MRLSRIKRRFVTLGGLTGLGSASLLSGAVLLEPQQPTRRHEPTVIATVAPAGPRSEARVAPPAPALATLASRFEKLRAEDSVAVRRERAYLLHEIARIGTKESRAFLLELAKRENAEPIERLAAVSALAGAGDQAALDAIAASTSDALVKAKIKVMRERKPWGGRS